MAEKIVLAYSGGLDTSVAIKWLQDKYEAEVVTVTVDLGQQEDLQEIGARARHLGVLRHYALDARAEFVDKYVLPGIKANGLYEGQYPLSTALGRPLLALKLVEVAEKEGAFAVAHGCTGKGNDQVRFDVTVKSLNPQLKIIAPVREWNLSRDQEIAYAKQHGIPIKVKKSIFSIDQNLWGRSIESGPLEQPWDEPPPEAFEWTRPIEETPDQPAYLDIAFEQGLPTGLNGEELNGQELIARVNQIAGEHAVGVLDHMEDRLVGIKSREVYECPAAVTLITAHGDLEKLVLTRHQLAFKRGVEQEWAWLVYSGLWVDPLREDLDRFIDSTQQRVSGRVRMKLFKGSARVVGRTSPNSLYNMGLATYDASSTFDQKAAVGFIDLWGLPTRVAYGVRKADRSKGEVRVTVRGHPARQETQRTRA